MNTPTKENLDSIRRAIEEEVFGKFPPPEACRITTRAWTNLGTWSPFRRTPIQLAARITCTEVK